LPDTDLDEGDNVGVGYLLCQRARLGPSRPTVLGIEPVVLAYEFAPDKPETGHALYANLGGSWRTIPLRPIIRIAHGDRVEVQLTLR
jgi:hypothetical protein